MAIIAFENFKGQIQGANFMTEPQLLKGTPDGGLFGNSIIDPNRIPGTLSPFPVYNALTNASTIDTEVVKMVTYINVNADIYVFSCR